MNNRIGFKKNNNQITGLKNMKFSLRLMVINSNNSLLSKITEL